jgi:hypothetical protein
VHVPIPANIATVNALFDAGIQFLEDIICSDITSFQVQQQNWQNDKVRGNNTFAIAIAPFFNLTASRADLHRRKIRDCTHWIENHPLFWEPIWEFTVTKFNEIM